MANQATGQEAGAVYVSVMPSGQGFSKQMDGELTGAFDSSQRSGTVSFGRFFTRIAAAGAAILATLGLGRLVKNTVALGVSYNTLEQSSKAAFTTILGSADAAVDLQKQIREFAMTSPFPRQAFIQATQQMLGFGFAASEVIPTLDVIQDAVAAIGGGADEIALLTDVFSKIRSSGRVMSDDLNRLAQVGINAWEILATASGKSIDETRKQVSEGAIDSAFAIKALTDGMQVRFEGAAANLKGTWVGATDRIKGAYRDLSSALVAPFIDPNGGGYAVKWANEFADLLRGIEKSAGFGKLTGNLSDFGKRLDPIVNQVLALGKVLFEDDGKAKFFQALSDIPQLAPFAEAFKTIGQILEKLAPIAPQIGDAFLKLGEALLEKGVLDALVKLATDVLPPFVDLLAAVVGILPIIAGPLAFILRNALGLYQVASDTISGFSDMQLAAEAAKGTYGEVQGALIGFGTAVDNWFKGWTTAAGTYVYEAINNLGKFVPQVVDYIRVVLVNSLNGLISFINSFMAPLNALLGLLNAITGAKNKVGIPNIPGGTIDFPSFPGLASSGTILPRPGGTLIRAAEAGRAESIVDTGKLNALMDAASGGGSGMTVEQNLYGITDLAVVADLAAQRLVGKLRFG